MVSTKHEVSEPRATFTPGPWHVNAIDSKRNRITGDERSTGWDKLHINGMNSAVAKVYRGPDARLIAAAPALYAALKALVPLVYVDRLAYELRDATAEVRAALAQAEGRTL